MAANHDLEQHAESTDRLSIFREAVGITDVLSLGPRASKRSATNVGVFKRVVTAERNAQIQYYASAFLINACLLLQIVFAAALTALGAANGSHTQVTILGAANTVIAGLLSFTKGQGLPNRLRQYQNTLRKVREYIEQKERDFSQLDCKHDLTSEIKTVIEMYEAARQNDENNDPSAYHNPVMASTKPNSPSILEDAQKKAQSSGLGSLAPLVGKLKAREEAIREEIKEEISHTGAPAEASHAAASAPPHSSVGHSEAGKHQT